METNRTNENLQETWKIMENMMSKNTNSFFESYNQQLNYWNNYMNNVMSSFNNNTKNWPKFPFSNSTNMNDVWSNWMKNFYNFSWPSDGLNFGKSMSLFNNELMAFSKNSFNDYQLRLNQTQRYWTELNKSMNEHFSKQLEIWNQLLNFFIQSGNKMNECFSDTQKNIITESAKQNEKLFFEYQSIIQDVSKMMQQNNTNDSVSNKEQSPIELKRKQTNPVVVQ